jgi:hypothetical protein
MRLTWKDLGATVLVTAVVAPFTGYMVAGSVPFIQDPMGMAWLGLALGMIAAVVGGRITQSGAVARLVFGRRGNRRGGAGHPGVGERELPRHGSTRGTTDHIRGRGRVPLGGRDPASCRFQGDRYDPEVRDRSRVEASTTLHSDRGGLSGPGTGDRVTNASVAPGSWAFSMLV